MKNSKKLLTEKDIQLAELKKCSAIVIADQNKIIETLYKLLKDLDGKLRFKEYGGRGVRFTGSVSVDFWHEYPKILSGVKEFLKETRKLIPSVDESEVGEREEVKDVE